MKIAQTDEKTLRIGHWHSSESITETSTSPSGIFSITLMPCYIIPRIVSRYQANLKRDLPHIPYAPAFWEFADAGKRLAEIHIHYEEQEQYKLDLIETQDMPLDWRVAQMKFSKDKTQLKYNDFLTVAGIPAEAFQYQLGNRSALEWMVDQYRVKTDKRSGIVNDPNRPEDETYIVHLIRKVITVSLETVGIVDRLSVLDISVKM